MHVRVHLAGAGPRTRRICALLVKDALPEAVVGAYEDAGSAARAGAASAIPVVVLDARVAVDPEAFRRFALERGNASAVARRFDGTASDVVAARRFPNGEALRASAQQPGPAETIGAWIEEPDVPPAPARGEGVDVHAYGWGPSGFATASRNLIVGLHRAGTDVNWLRWFPEDGAADVVPQDRALLEPLEGRRARHPRALVFHPPTHTSGQYFLEAYARAYVGVPYACATMFETDGIPVHWVETIRQARRLWVPSAFNVETFAAAGVPREMIDLVPIGLDVENQPLDGETLTLPERRAVAFLSVFEWTYRKGWDVLLAAWAQAFTRDDDACLIVRTSFRNLDIEASIRQYLERTGCDPRRVAPIVVLPKKLSQAQLVALYRTADAYVLPSRGEGFGLPYLEAMTLGLPAVGTAWSGLTDFLDARSGYPIDARLVPITSPMITRIVPIYRDQRWAEPSIASTVAQLRRVYERRDEAALIGARGMVIARTQFNRTRVGRIAAEALERIEAAPQRAIRLGGAGTVRLAGELYALDGHGGEARSLLAALAAQRFDVALDDAGPPTWSNFLHREDAARIRAAGERRRDADAPLVVVAPQRLLPSPADGTRGPRIARAVATEATLHPSALADLRACDEVWVPSTFSAERFAAAGLEPGRLVVVPPAIETQRWVPQIGGLEVSPRASSLRVLVVTDWTPRSGWDLAIAAFLRAFEAAEDVVLTVKVTPRDPALPVPEYARDVGDAIGRLAPERLAALGSYPIGITTGVHQDVDMLQYYGSFDVLLVAGREIGWGRPILEAMAAGMTVVAPRSGNHRAYLNEDVAYLVDATPTAKPTWFEPSLPGLAQALRRIADRREESAARGHAARRHAVANHDLAAVGALLRDRLERRVRYRAPEETAAAPAPDARLGIVVDAREPSAGLVATLRRLERTRSPHTIVVLGAAGALPAGVAAADSLADAFAYAGDAGYAAYVRADVLVPPSWDDFLIDALRVRPHAGLAVPYALGAPGAQGDLQPAAGFDVSDLEPDSLSQHGFDAFARSLAVVNTGRGTAVGLFSTSCVVFDGATVRETLARTPESGASIEALARAVVASGRTAWCAFDAVVHAPSAVRAVVDLAAALAT